MPACSKWVVAEWRNVWTNPFAHPIDQPGGPGTCPVRFIGSAMPVSAPSIKRCRIDFKHFFFGYDATLFNDHCCGYPVFGQINHNLGFPIMKTGSTTPSKPEDDWYIRYRDENAASAKAKGIADGVFSILTYNNVHHTGWPQSSSIYAIDPFEVFSEERPEVVESWILRSQKMLSSNYPVGEAIVGQHPTRDMLEDQFIALNPGFSKESYGYAIYLGCVAAR